MPATTSLHVSQTQLHASQTPLAASVGTPNVLPWPGDRPPAAVPHYDKGFASNMPLVNAELEAALVYNLPITALASLCRLLHLGLLEGG